MRGFLAVAQREVVDRRMWLVAALAAGLIPLAAPLLPWVGSGTAAEARSMLASVLAATLVTAGALALGLSMVGSDLAERRFGFYFARPLSAGAIWWGKLAGSFLIVVLVGVLAAVPAALVGGTLVLQEVAGLPSDVAVFAGAAAVFVLLVLGLAHALGVMGRSRSVWIVADLVAAVAVGGALWAVGRRFMLAGPGTLMTWLLASSLAAVLVALLAAGWVQVAVGRTDPRRGHRALSATLWGALGSFALTVVGYATWVFAATPSSLDRLWEVMPAREGSWVVVSGDSAGRGDYYPAFLLDTATGRWVRLEPTSHWCTRPTAGARCGCSRPAPARATRARSSSPSCRSRSRGPSPRRSFSAGACGPRDCHRAASGWQCATRRRSVSTRCRTRPWSGRAGSTWEPVTS